MSSPSTHQDSPKVPERPWPRVVYARRKADWIVPPSLSVNPGPATNETDLEEEAYIPVSALLSDEAIDRACVRFEQLLNGEDFQFEFPESFMREALQAVVEQVGGGQGG